MHLCAHLQIIAEGVVSREPPSAVQPVCTIYPLLPRPSEEVHDHSMHVNLLEVLDLKAQTNRTGSIPLQEYVSGIGSSRFEARVPLSDS